MIGNEDEIVTAFAEYSSGHVLNKRQLWVIVRGEDNKLRQECIKLEDQSDEMRTLFRLSNVAHAAMSEAVMDWVSKVNARRRRHKKKTI